jgi:double-stranded uracil-DNA glycosylase
VTRVRSFGPLAGTGATVLLLGSMPGIASLRAGQYYAHPRNLFWPILGELVGAHPGLPYDERVGRLGDAGIAVWDVLRSCRRAGSLDADIDGGSIVPNDFPSFFAAYPRITRVFFNGSTAERCYRRCVLSRLSGPALEYTRLPSTSPAHAALTYERKLEAWRAILPPRHPSARRRRSDAALADR